MKKILIAILILFIFNGIIFAFPDCSDICTVTRVIDGDTIVANCLFRKHVIIRLNTIDAFESKKYERAYRQANKFKISIDEVIDRGRLAKKITKNLLLNKNIAIYFRERKYGVYGRLLADIYIVNNNKWINVNNYLLAKYPNLYFLYKYSNKGDKK